MNEDRDILREVWEGRVPVCVSLAEEEVLTAGGGKPEPCYLMAQRITYFPLLLDKVQRYFVKFVDPMKAGEMWLECEGQPLKWHIPVGVLFDLFASKDSLPWKLIAHFHNFPERELLHCPSRDAVEAHYMSCVKEADALKHKGQVISNMQKRDHKQLWNGLLADKFDQFWAINKKLMERPVGGGIGDSFRYIPHRLYKPDGTYTQKLIRPCYGSGGGGSEGTAETPATLADLLELHDHMAAGQGDGSGSSEEPDRGYLRQPLVHGIAVPLDTPLVWMTEFLSHPDNFLHIIPA